MSDDHPVPLLESREPITVEVLEAILKDAKKIDTGVLDSLRVAGVKISGLVGSVARIHVQYDPASASGPSSLIVKWPSTESEDGRELSSVEAKFYSNRIPDSSSIRTPEVYYCGLDEQTKRSCLLLEDVGDRGFVRQIDGCSKEEATRAIRQIAKLHARWWNRELPPHLNWIRPPGQSRVGLLCKRWIQSYPGAWPAVLGWLPRRLRERYDDIGARLISGPRTIVHGDFHSQNVAFREGEGDCTLIDFQFVQHASGMLDVARFLATSPPTDVRRAIESDVLGEYHSSLEAGGVEDYDFDRCVDAFRAALLWNLSTPLALHIVGIMTQGYQWPPRLPIIERCLAAIDDWNATEMLER